MRGLKQCVLGLARERLRVALVTRRPITRHGTKSGRRRTRHGKILTKMMKPSQVW